MRQALVDEAKRLYAFGWDKVKSNTELTYQAAILYQKIKGQPPCCLDTALKPFYIDEIPIIIKNDIFLNQKQLMKTDNFKLKDSLALYVDSLNEYITNGNLTDENAVAYLKEKPSGISNFEKVPANVEKFIEDFVPATSDETPAIADSAPADHQLKELNRVQLLQVAADHDFPSDEYQELKRKDLIAYLNGKLNK